MFTSSPKTATRHSRSRYSRVATSGRRSGHLIVAGGLFAPYGVALRSGAAYVTTCAVCVDEGEVIRIPLD